ncbi:sulfatase family protein [Halococcus agarilyticus]|uniref:sulfatase family protein n=1 Tax=Halococcus agarilyticus TaxID=1232219 RepID=UPI000677886F|nr:sulfatase [Halococcus agarilyticus]
MRVLLVDIDSLRPDRLGTYGYSRNTSPTIDAIAENGVRFDRCFTADSPCLPSRTSLATARFGVKHGAVTHWGEGQWLDLHSRRGNGGDYPPDRPLSFRHLSDAGINTSTITSFSKRHSAYHFSGSFRESIQPTPGMTDNGATVTDTATAWIDDHADADDWLLHLNYWDVHHPYLGIDEFVDDVRESGPGAQWIDREVLAEQEGATGVRSRSLWPSPSQHEVDGKEYIDYGDWPMPVEIDTPEKAQHINDGYDASIRKVDAEVERLLSTLERHGIRDETAIVVTADHGEALGEHGIYAEHALAHPPCQRVPMIVDVPGESESAGSAVEDFVYQFDLLPTLCELFGVETPSGWDAEPFTAALRNEPFEGREYLVCGHGIYTFSRAVYEGDWMYARIHHPGVFSVPGLYNDPELPNEGLEILHDLAEDPHLRENLIGERPEITRRLRSRIDEWREVNVNSAEAHGRDQLHEMAATDGPYLYVDPNELADSYRELGFATEQIERVADAADAFERRTFPH